MKRFWFLMLAMGMLVTARGQDINKTGLLFGENFVFYMTAPSGWVLDNQSGVKQGQHMVFYPEGNTWEDSPVVAYGNSVELTSTIRSIEDFVGKTIQEFRQGGSFYIKSRKQKTIPLAEGKKADIYYYTGDKWGNYEAVGYILEKKTINFLVYSAREKRVFEENLDKFFEILKSYKNVFREDADNYSEQTFNALKAKAEEAESTAQGKEYEDLLSESLESYIVEKFTQCLAYHNAAESIPKIDIVFIIAEDGTIEDSYVWPVTPLSLCVKGTIASLQMPPHKLGKFYHRVFLDITFEDRTKNALYGESEQDKSDAKFPRDVVRFLKIGSPSPNAFSAQGFFNAYEYWASFKPGSYVTYKIVSTRAGTTNVSTKTFTVKEVSPEKVVIEVRESFGDDKARPQGAGLARTADFSFALWPDTPPWEKEDLYHGFLSLDISNLSQILWAADASSDTEDVEIKDVRLETQRVQFRLNTVTITFWYLEDIPGGIARYKKEVIAPVSLQEEILVEDFRTDRRDPAEYRELTQKPRSQMKASAYLGKNMRFFWEAQLVEDGLLTFIKYETFPELFAKKVGNLLKKAREWKAHFEEDLKNIDSQLPEKERQKLEPFLKQAAEYCSVSTEFLDTCDKSLLKLSITANIPESFWPSMKDKMNEIIASMNQSFMKYITARSELKNIEITITR